MHLIAAEGADYGQNGNEKKRYLKRDTFDMFDIMCVRRRWKEMVHCSESVDR